MFYPLFNQEFSICVLFLNCITFQILYSSRDEMLDCKLWIKILLVMCEIKLKEIGEYFLVIYLRRQMRNVWLIHFQLDCSKYVLSEYD